MKTENQGQSELLIDAEVASEARAAFRDRLIEKAMAARLKYGLYIDADAVEAMLDDREVVRYPVTIDYDARPLRAEEFAFVQPLGFHASDGHVLCIHPWFQGQREILPLLVAYHIPVINFGEIVEAVDAELFGATLLGLEVDAYYQALCELVDSISP